MATDTTQISTALRKDLQKAQALYSNKNKVNCADRLVGGNKITDTQSYIKAASFTRPGLLQPIGERESLPEGRYDKVNTTTYPASKFGLLVSFSHEAVKDNQYRSTVAGAWGTDLMDLAHTRREIFVQNYHFNDANTNTGPDGVALGSNAHPLDSDTDLADVGLTAATATNIVEPTDTVGVSLLNAARTLLKRTRDNKGIIDPIVGPMDVFCSDLREVLWSQVKTGVQEEPFTPDRNKGEPYAKMIGSIVTVPYSEHDDWTMFQTTDSDMQSNWIWDREAPNISELEYKKRNDTFEGNIIMRLATGQFDWRGRVYCFAGA